MILRSGEGGRFRAPARFGSLLFLVGRDAERDASVERHDVELDIETLPVFVRPRSADPREVAFVLAVANVIGDMGCATT
jgi:hypothetical protein